MSMTPSSGIGSQRYNKPTKTLGAPPATPVERKKPPKTTSFTDLLQRLNTLKPEGEDRFFQTEAEPNAEDTMPPPPKRSRLSDDDERHTTEARPEKSSFKPINLLVPEYRYTGLVEMPQVTVPSLEAPSDSDEKISLPLSHGRHRDKPEVSEKDPFFDFLLNAIDDRKQ
jgi:hypothetical protein